MEIDELAGRVTEVGAGVAGTGTILRHTVPGAGAAGGDAFGGDGPGGLAALCREMRERLSAAVAAREREASAYGARIDALAEALRRAAAGYRESEDGARARHDGIR